MSTAVIHCAPRRITSRRLEPTPSVPRVPAMRGPGASAPGVSVSRHTACDGHSGHRLTRRGRLVLVATVLLLVFAAVAVLSAPAVSTSDAHHATSHSVVVASGETLWDIAQRIAPGQDPRDVIAEIVDLNALSDAGAIRVGQKLFVPAG